VRLSFNKLTAAHPTYLPPLHMHELVPLSLLQPGQQAWIDHVVGRADDVHRLEELGMRVGSAIEVVQAGSPCIVRLGGSKLCFRACDMTSVLVRLQEAA
jgi:ferrous iron transport protein A